MSDEVRVQKRNGFSIGDRVRLPCVPSVFEVVGLEDESLVQLRTPTGRTITAGWRALSRVKQ